jgi:Uncharacterised protein family UPF0047
VHSHRKVLTFHLAERMGFLNITRDVTNAVHESGIQEGLCLVNAMHITASVFINDDERGYTRTTSGGWRNSRPSTRGAILGRAVTCITDRERTYADHGPRGRGCRHRWPIGFRAVGADLLW